MTKGKGILVILAMILALAGVTWVDVYGIDDYGTISASDITLGLDLAGGVSITYQVVGEEAPDATDMQDTISKLQQRVFKYSTEALVYQEGEDRINIEIPGVSDANKILEELGKPGQLYFISQTGSDGTENYTGSYVVDSEGNYDIKYELNKTLDELEADGSIKLVGTDVKEARAMSYTDSMQNTEIGVELLLTDEGKEKFAKATTEAIGKTLAIYYDGNFVCVPTVQDALTDGKASITGNYTWEEAEALASTIRIGGLKLELEELHSKVVGAQLGSEAISTSLKAAAIGLVVVAVFMVVVYFISGVAATLALLLYTALIVLLLNGFDLTLTLSGIAGIILSIGMAVDANVIIFARIKEELAKGKTVKSSIDIGFKKANSAIIDGNVTTLIAAAVLWIFGSGSIRGFAQTLVLGIALSMFTALIVTRLLMHAFYAIGFKKEKWYGVAKERKAFNFVGRKAIFIAISLVVIAGGFVMMGINKVSTGEILNFGLDFKGGTATTVTFNKEYDLAAIESEILPKFESIIGSAVQPQPVQGTNEVVFKSNTLTDAQRAAVDEMLMNEFGVMEGQIQSETISSTISNEMKSDTIIAVAIAIVCMLFYIRLRFKDLRFGVSGVVALLHDVLVVLAFYAVAKVSVGSTFIACMLTIVGYSINATIVIFDRIRENREEEDRLEDLDGVVNKSITQTLSRSLFTSLTTFIMVAALYILGVTAIKEFALPLMVGIAAGTYSSICLAGALWYILKKKIKDRPKKVVEELP
ncbi:MAG: protein translocase subunit SecD [Lachnospiraceae bacterium]|nr:protein translocase subunit SecD [Lachnospiraceae bacterium]